jgi:hypothetical protein
MNPPLHAFGIQGQCHTEITHLPFSIQIPINRTIEAVSNTPELKLSPRTLVSGIGSTRHLESDVNQGCCLGDLPVYPGSIPFACRHSNDKL